MENAIEQIKDWLAIDGRKKWELAQILNVPAPTLSRWLNGKTKISNAYLSILKSKGIIHD